MTEFIFKGIGVLIGIALGAVIAGAVTLFVWNVGVVGAVAALGGKASTISLWTAIGLWVALLCLGHGFKKTTVNNKA